MATNYKILGQTGDDAGILQTLYTVPAATEAVVSTISIANVAVTATDFTIHVVPSGDTAGVRNVLAKEVALPASDTTTLTLGITLSAGDSIQVKSSAYDTCFHAFGSEIS